MRKLVTAFLMGVLTACAHAQGESRTMAERLGHPRDARILIVNADDLGMSRSVDEASLRALEKGEVTSVSVMVPGPTFAQVAAYARAHPGVAMGLHLTLTSEWTGARWGPILPAARVPSLVRPDGSFPASAAELLGKVNPRDAEAELRAQIERAKAEGIRPTHLDSHMAVLYQSQALFEIFVRLGRDYGVPVRVSRDLVSRTPFMAQVLRPTDLVIDRRATIATSVPPERWTSWYENAIRTLEPGVTELIVHLGSDDAELRATTGGATEWGSAWRERDRAYFTSGLFQRAVRDQGIILISWRDVGARARPLLR